VVSWKVQTPPLVDLTCGKAFYPKDR